MDLFVSLRSEIVKTKRTAALYFTLIGAAVIPVMFLFNVLTDGLPDEDRSNKDPLNAMFRLAGEMTSLGILPLFLVLICTLLPQIEHKNNTWKQVLTSPQTKLAVFTAKYLHVHLLILVFLMAGHLLMWIVAVVAHFILPDLNVLNQPLSGREVLLGVANSYVILLAVCTIQFWMGMRFKNFLVPVSIGLVLWLTGTVLALEYHSDLANYFPYSFQVFNFSSAYKSGLQQIKWTSFGYAVLIFVAAFFDFRKKRPDG